MFCAIGGPLRHLLIDFINGQDLSAPHLRPLKLSISRLTIAMATERSVERIHRIVSLELSRASHASASSLSLAERGHELEAYIAKDPDALTSLGELCRLTYHPVSLVRALNLHLHPDIAEQAGRAFLGSNPVYHSVVKSIVYRCDAVSQNAVLEHLFNDGPPPPPPPPLPPPGHQGANGQHAGGPMPPMPGGPGNASSSSHGPLPGGGGSASSSSQGPFTPASMLPPGPLAAPTPASSPTPAAASAPSVTPIASTAAAPLLKKFLQRYAMEMFRDANSLGTFISIPREAAVQLQCVPFDRACRGAAACSTSTLCNAGNTADANPDGFEDEEGSLGAVCEIHSDPPEKETHMFIRLVSKMAGMKKTSRWTMT